MLPIIKGEECEKEPQVVSFSRLWPAEKILARGGGGGQSIAGSAAQKWRWSFESRHSNLLSGRRGSLPASPTLGGSGGKNSQTAIIPRWQPTRVTHFQVAVCFPWSCLGMPGATRGWQATASYTRAGRQAHTHTLHNLIKCWKNGKQTYNIG